MDDFVARREGGPVVRESRDKTLRGCGERERAEVEARDDCQGTARTDEQFMQVVAGDIFYDAAAGFDLRAVAVDEFRAEEKIARGAVGVAQRRIETTRDGAADRCLRVIGNEQREKLIVLAQHRVELRERHARANTDGQISGIVVGDVIERGEIESDVIARWSWRAEKLGAGTNRNY